MRGSRDNEQLFVGWNWVGLSGEVVAFRLSIHHISEGTFSEVTGMRFLSMHNEDCRTARLVCRFTCKRRVESDGDESTFCHGLCIEARTLLLDGSERTAHGNGRQLSFRPDESVILTLPPPALRNVLISSLLNPSIFPKRVNDQEFVS